MAEVVLAKVRPPLYDSNILIDFLNGLEAAKLELRGAQDRAISELTWIEVMVGSPAGMNDVARAFLRSFEQLSITPEVAERAVLIRKATKIKLPDAIILATAEANGRVLVTRNTRDFGVGSESVRVPYAVS